MIKPKVDLPDVFKTRFLVTLAAKLKSRRPKILDITEISISRIAKTMDGKVFDFRAVIKGVDQEKVPFQIGYEHIEECVWVPIILSLRKKTR